MNSRNYNQSKQAQRMPAASARSQATMPGRALQRVMRSGRAPQPLPTRPVPHQPMLKPHETHRPGHTNMNKRWLILTAILGLGMMVIFAGTIALYVMLAYAGGVLPGVHVAEIDLGGLSRQEAEAKLAAQWQSLRIRDADRIWTVPADDLGISLNLAATVEAAYATGRGGGNLLGALFGRVDINPIITADADRLADGLHNLAVSVNIAPRNAGITLVNGSVQPTPAEAGRLLDVETTSQRILVDQDTLADGVVELSMLTIAPAITDATPILAEAQRLLSNPLTIRAYDPVTGDFVHWSQQPDQWAMWLQASANPTGDGLSFALDEPALRAFLVSQSRVFDESRYLKIDEATAQIQAAMAANNLRPAIRVYHRERIHNVQAGETIVSIAWDYGVPYPWVQQANPGVDSLLIGQTLKIPSPDEFMPFEVIPDKRIEVSISEQRVRVYENQELKWDWPASTGINSSPTWPGIYQIISHFPNAYAANWDLWMPNFMGVYHPIPGSDFTNGFHGFPTRGGGQILWENSLGTRVTYGCILLSNTNEQLLYDWAQEGVVVEIQP